MEEKDNDIVRELYPFDFKTVLEFSDIQIEDVIFSLRIEKE